MIILFGSTGDLAKEKLMPALFNLYEKGIITQTTPILCVGRKKLTKNSYIDHIELDKKLPSSKSMIISGFQQLINYVRVDYDKKDFSNLFSAMKKLDRENNCRGNKIFYLATPPSLFSPITEILQNSPAITGKGWKRVIYEKPFGYDLKSARELNKKIRKCFSEGEIYRVDHYLGKELVQNILAARFSNSFLKYMWNNKFVDHIQITLAESKGIGTRADYYENAGAIKDMLQNHIMQLLSLTAMDEPQNMDPETIRNKKARVVKSLNVPPPKDIVTGQYTSGTIGEEIVKGYTQEENVAANSKTETFVATKLSLNSTQLKGVPVYLRTGKRMKESFGRIDVVLKDMPNKLFENKSKYCDNNIFTIKIRPDEGIQITLNTKEPGELNKLVPVNLDFCHQCRYGPNTPEAYEMLFKQIMHGDQTLFPRWDEVEASWKFIDPFIHTAKKSKFSKYKAGTQPKEADTLLRRDNHAWMH